MIGASKGDTRRLDYSSYGSCLKYLPQNVHKVGSLFWVAVSELRLSFSNFL